MKVFRSGWRLAFGLAAMLYTLPSDGAEVQEVHVATQYGFGFLPMMVIEHEHMFDRRLAGAGQTSAKVRWIVLGGGSAVNDALLSGSLDIASGGTAPFILLWARARSKLDVRAISALDSVPLWFNTRDPDVMRLEDLSAKDKIAVTAPRVSVHAVLLEIAASKRWGMKDFAHYDSLTFALPQPDSLAALLSGVVNNHFSAPPYEYIEARQPGIRTITTGEDILGGPATFIVTWTTARFRAENPRTYGAFLAATEDAIDYINKDPNGAATIYLEMSHDKMSQAEVLQLLLDPNTHFTTTPQNVMTFAKFMYDVGTIKTQPNSWKDMFFPEVHGLSGG
jgi:NitT/TauT family transport system substrate-binding protein